MKAFPFQEVRSFYARRQPEGYWFSAGALKFFKSKLPANAYEGKASVLFVTRETNPSGVSAYSVRRQRANADIETVGEFHSFKTGADARAEIKRLHTLG